MQQVGMKEQKASRATGILSTTFGEGRPQTDTVTDFSLLAVSTIIKATNRLLKPCFLVGFFCLKTREKRRGQERKAHPFFLLSQLHSGSNQQRERPVSAC